MSEKINVFNFKRENIRILHLTWFAFFLTFVMWFNHAPLMASIAETFGLTKPQLKTLLILNVALTIPARIMIGALVDKFGPRLVYSTLLFISGLLCFFFATAQSFETLALARFLMGFIGAGFVIGIRMIGEWFPAKQVGLAEGIYGGWGNFGSAAAALTLPTVALMYGGDDGWRYAVASTGVLALIYSVVYFLRASDTPKGSTYFRPNKIGGMEVTSKSDFYLCLLMNIPMVAVLAVLAWKLSPAGVSLLSQSATYVVYAVLLALYVYQAYSIYNVNRDVLKTPVEELHRYKFKQVAMLDIAYFVTFGSELAVVSMLPLYFKDTFNLSIVEAGWLASGFAFMNLVARPTGGLFSDKFGRKGSLAILIAGLSVGYFLLANITPEWPLALAVISTMACSFFVQAGEGAVFAIVPLIKRRLTGQIAGMAGAYGNVGAVTFLTVYSFVTPEIFFYVIAAAAVFALALIMIFMEEPSGQIAEILPDGTVQMIDVG